MDMGIWNWAARRFIFLFLWFVPAANAIGLNYVFMEVRNKVDLSRESLQLCANVDLNLFRVATEKEEAKWMSLLNMTESNLDPDSLCTGLPVTAKAILLGKMPVVVDRPSHVCSSSGRPLSADSLRSSTAAESNSTGVLVINSHMKLWAAYAPWVNQSTSPNVPIFATSRSTYNQMKALLDFGVKSESELEVRFFRPTGSAMDWTFVIIWLIAVGSVAVGGWWSGYTKQNIYEASLVSTSNLATGGNPLVTQGSKACDASLRSAGDRSDSEPPSTPLNFISVITFLGIIVAMLLLLYFFPRVMVWFVIVVFTVASSFATFACLSLLIGFIPYCKCRVQYSLSEYFTQLVKRPFCLPCCREKIEIRLVIVYLGCAALSICWFVYRHENFEFLMRDILGVCFCVNLINSLRLPSLKWITTLLTLVLVYDVFFVFITPLFTKGRCSIMIDVVTGGACTNDIDKIGPSGPPTKDQEEIPVVFKVPRLGDPIFSCYDLQVDLEYPSAMLGFGDILLPGFLVAFCAGFDRIWKIQFSLYWSVSVVGYGVGMAVTFMALILMAEGQPALVYLVPCTLIPVHLVALWKGQWSLLWAGDFPPSSDLSVLCDSSPHCVVTNVVNSPQFGPNNEGDISLPNGSKSDYILLESEEPNESNP